MDVAHDLGFHFDRIAEGPDGPLVGESLTNTKTATHRPLRVILMRRDATEHRHHTVTRRLRHLATRALNLPPKQRLIRSEKGLHFLDIQPLRPTCEPDQVSEQDRNDSPLATLRRCRVSQRRA